MLRWTEQALRWYKAAEQTSVYFDRLAQIVVSEFPPSALVYDLGCGNGALAFRLAAKGLQVRAVDQNSQAINEVARRNQEVRCQVGFLQEDYSRLETNVSYPIFCLCGDIRDDLALLSAWGSKSSIIITLDDKVLPFKIEPKLRKAISSDQAEAFLESVGLAHTTERVVEEFGQPLLDLQDAEAFARHHNPQASPQMITMWLEQNLQKFRSPDYQYYFPNLKRVTVFKIDLLDTSLQVI